MQFPTLFSHDRRGTQPQDPFSQLRSEMDRLFDSFGAGTEFARAGGFGRVPSLDVSETENAVIVEADIPGFEEKEVDVSLTGDLLTIKGERNEEHKDEKKDYHLVERRSGAFHRALRLPFQPEPDKVEASFRNGVLTVTLPKPASAASQARKIDVKSA